MRWIVGAVALFAFMLAADADQRAKNAQARLWQIEQKLGMH